MTETTINFKGINLLVKGNYDPGEEQIRYYDDMSGYPGSPSSFEIQEIFVEDSNINIWELFSWADLETIEELTIEQIEK